MPLHIADNLHDLMSNRVAVDTPVYNEIIGRRDGKMDENEYIDLNDGQQFYEFVGGEIVSSPHARYEIETVGWTRAILGEARDCRLPPPRMHVVGLDDDDAINSYGAGSVEDITILGATVESEFPLTTRIYNAFKKREAPKYVRLDSPESYADFRASQSPEMASLIDKVEELDELLHAHIADGHGAQTTVMGADDAAALSELGKAVKSKEVPLSLPPWADGKYECWREGDIVCCSINLPGCDGDIRVCTSATPIADHAVEVVGCARRVGCNDVTPLLGVLPTVACMMAGGSLIPQMAAAAPRLLARPEARSRKPFIGRLVSESSNRETKATLMTLLQHAQSGDPQAVSEWQKLAKLANQDARLAKSMGEAKDRLVKGQR